MFLLEKIIKKYFYFWKNISIVFLVMFIGKGISFFWKIILARIDISSLGFVEVILTSITLLLSFSLLGIQTSIVRFMAIALHKKNFKKIYAYLFFCFKVVITTSLIVVLTGLLFTDIFNKFLKIGTGGLPGINKFIWILPFIAVTEIIISYLNAIKKIKIYSIIKYIFNPLFRIGFLLIFLIFNLAGNKHLLIQVLLAYFFTFIFSLLVSDIKKLKFFSLSKKDIKKFIQYTLPMTGSFLFFTIYGASDIFLLNYFTNLKIVGDFAILIIFADLIDLFLLPSLNFFQSFLGKFNQNKKEGLEFILFNILVFLVIGLIIIFLVFLLKGFLIKYLFKKEIIAVSNLLLFVMLLKLVQSGIILPLRHFLDFYGHTNWTLKLMIGALTVKVIFAIFFIINFGLVGLFYALAIAEFIHLTGCLFYTRKAVLIFDWGQTAGGKNIKF